MTERALQSDVALVKRDWLHIVSVALCVIGLFVAGYLAYAELISTEAMMCPADGDMIFGLPVDCGTVNVSSYAKVGPIPVALLGLGGYLVILGVLLLKDRLPLLQEYWHLLFFGLTLFGFAFSMYLTWAEVSVIKAFCTWCMASAILMALLFAISLIRFWQVMNADEEYDE